MEASVAGQGQGDAGNADGGGESGGQPDLAAIAEQLKGTATGQEEMRQQVTQLQEFLQTQPWQAEAEGETAGDDGEVDLSFLDATDPEFDPAQMADKLGDLINATVEERVKPLQEKTDQIERDRGFEHLAAELPELQDPEVAKEVGAAVHKLAEEMGRPDLVHEPRMWKVMFMAGKAAELANEEGAETPSAAHLEGGGGAAPAGSQVDPLAAMFAAAQGGKSVLPFQ